MKPTTRAQREACHRLWSFQGAIGETYLQFRRRFRWSGVGTDLYLFGEVFGMWIGIEYDGYTHS